MILFSTRSSRPVQLLLMFVLGFFPLAASALTVENLYVAEVLVTGEGERELRTGARSGLLQVLVRVSGDPTVEDSTLIRSALRSPSTYYYQYSYESTDKTLIVDGEPVPAQTLRLHFEPSAVARLLRQGGFQVWGSNRPGVLLWLAINDESGRRIISENDTSQLVSLLKDQSNLRGVPLLFPLLDLEDESAITTGEIWGAFLGRIFDASVRYNPDVILTARISQDTIGRWEANWSWHIEDEWQVEETVAFSLDELVAAKVDKLATELAERYAIDSTRSQMSVRVESVDSLAAYAAVTEYLESLAPVVDSAVVRIQGEEVVFRLNTEGQDEQLLKVIELDEKMVLINSDSNQELFHFRWMGR